MKRALEGLSCELGRGGAIDDAVLEHAGRHPADLARAARTMRRRPGLPEVAAPAARPAGDGTRTIAGGGDHA
jgi:hypothetical protein